MSITVSAVITTYNSTATIRGTIESVLAQSAPADEILVMDDGSTDKTVSILESFGPRVTILRQPNQGVAAARNALCACACGKLIAFLDHDDVWHPDYLKVQRQLFGDHPNASMFFTGHATFYGASDFNAWQKVIDMRDVTVEQIPAVNFIRRYHEAIGDFMSPSYCCVPKSVLDRIGARPFCEEVSGVDDCFIFHQLPFFGPVILCHAQLAAYRVTQTAQSANRVKGAGLAVRAMELLEGFYKKMNDAKMLSIYHWALAAQRREFGKVLMGAGKTAEARRQFALAIGSHSNPVSIAKSIRLLLLSMMPRAFQPQWLPSLTPVQSAG